MNFTSSVKLTEFGRALMLVLELVDRMIFKLLVYIFCMIFAYSFFLSVSFSWACITLNISHRNTLG